MISLLVSSLHLLPTNGLEVLSTQLLLLVTVHTFANIGVCFNHADLRECLLKGIVFSLELSCFLENGDTFLIVDFLNLFLKGSYLSFEDLTSVEKVRSLVKDGIHEV
jgi:hypothetical protein